MNDMDAQIRASFETALADIERKEMDLRTLEVHVGLYGYTISGNVPYDGDCFFSAIAHHLAVQSQSQHVRELQAAELRSNLVSFMSSKVNGHVFL
jgi:hypothetical protein